MKQVLTSYTYPNPPTMCCGHPLEHPVMVQRVEEFTLSNPPPKPAKVPLGNESNGGTQKYLLTGLDCLPDQLDLFTTDGGPE